jgi:aspartate-semialdehyde dehydrogenase
MSTKKIPVAVVGATGLAGQQFLASLAGHPWFEVTKLAASPRSAGKTLRAALTEPSGAFRWYCGEPLDPAHAELLVEDAEAMDASKVSVVFSAVEADAAKALEPRYAKAGAGVISTASAFRYEADVPILIPGVNVDHSGLIEAQRKQRGWTGFITPGPNCTTIGLAITLMPLHQTFGVKRVIMTSLQAVSGAGRSPGVLGLDILDNVVPYIPKEEEKVEIETRKVLGQLASGRITPADIAVSCTCTRVAVLEGHTESVFVELARKASVDEAKAAMRGFGEQFLALGLPSAPPRLIHVHEDPYRPQPRLDRDMGNGMITVVGRVREDQALASATGSGLKYVLVSHNTKMGAARGGILTAEYLVKQGFIPR